MKKLSKKKGLLLSLGCVMLSAFSVGTVVSMSGCKKNKDDEKPATYTSDGSYYLSAVDGEYALSMSVGQCSLTIGNVTKFGTYQEEGNAVSFAFEDGTMATATVTNGSVTLSYNNATLVFLKKVDYTVSYSVDGAVASTQKVLNGKKVSRPADPVKEGYIFIGWYTDAEYTAPFAFDVMPVLADTTLYARFASATVGQNEYKVSYIVDGQEVKEETTKGGVIYNYNVEAPTKENATFVGWWMSDYQDSTKLTCQYTGQVLTENTNLYAVWADAKAQVSVNANGVKWNALGAGTNFTVTIYHKGAKVAEQKTTSLEFAYDFTTKSAGDYEITVSANNQTTTVYYQNKALDRVSLFTVAEPSVLVYNAVENAEKYIITIDCGNDEHAHTEVDNGTFTSFNFANCEMQEGGVTFTVKAVANGYVTSVSETYAYSRDLSAITGVAFNAEDGMLRWNAVSKATSYKVEVKVGDKTDVYEVYSTNFSLAQYTGEVSVKVYAVANGYNYSSISYNYTCEKLVAPMGLNMNNNMLKWNAVDGATGYNVRIGSKLFTSKTTEFALPEEYKENGKEFNVSVQAVGATETANSYYSKAISVKYGAFKNVYYGNGALNWDAVGGANSYVVTINNNSVVDGSETTFMAGTTSAELTFKTAGTNKVVITALNNINRELDSKVIYVETSEVIFDTRTPAGVTKLYKAVGDKLAVADPAYRGYDFAGWYNVPAPLGEANNGAKLESMVFTGATANAFYASWASKEFEVTLKAGDKTVGTATLKYGKKFTLSPVVSEDSTKTFGGWFASDNSQGEQYTNPYGESANIWQLDSDDVTLYAGWIDVLQFEVIPVAGEPDGKAYQVKAADGIKYVKEVTVPATYNGKAVTTLAPEAFYYCSSLETINIPDTIRWMSINAGSIHATGSSFYQCKNLKAINVYCVDGEHTEEAKHDTYYSSVDGVLIQHNDPNATLANGVQIALFPAAKTGHYVVPSNVQYIPKNTFYKANITSIEIPASVAAIGKEAFKDADLLESVTFKEAENGVQEASELVIEDGAFSYCGVLKSVVFPSRLKETAFKAKNIFLYDYKLTELSVTKNAEGKTAFYTSNEGMLCDSFGATLLYCPTGRVGEVTIPVAIEEIGVGAFDGCTKITSVIIGDNVRKIHENAFYGCTKLETLDMRGETGSLEIASQAFYGCSVLKDLVIPKNVTKIGANAFGNTNNLKKVTLNGTNIDYANGAFANLDGKGYVTHLTIGKTLGAFEINGVFQGCEIQTVVEEEPGENANYVTDNGVLYTTGKAKLLFYPFGKTETTFTFDANTTEIGAGAFYNKTNLKSINIPATIVAIGNDAFKGASAMETVTFDARTANLTIGNNVFDGCSALKQIQVPEKTTAVGNNAFNGCMALTKVELPASLITLGDNAFTGCSKLASVEVTNGNEKLASKSGILYSKTGDVLTDIKFIPAGLKGEIVLPKTLKNIGESQFKSHAGITKISFEDNTTTDANFSIGASAFEDMKALTTIVLPNNLKVIPNYAFKNSKKLTAVEVPKTVTEIGTGAFLNATLCEITFETGGTADLVIKAPSSDDSSQGVFYGVKASEIILPERMTKIPARCFYQSTITKVTIPSTVQEIGTYAFYQCKLTEVNFATNTQGKRALTTVGNGAFSGCSVLTEVTVPNITNFTMLNTTWYQLFYNCTALTTVIMEEGWTRIPSSTFNGSGITTIKTKKADGTIVDGLPSTIKTIETQAFMNCKSLTSLKLNEGLTTIGSSAFSGCKVLSSIEIPASVETIETGAFGGGATAKMALATLTFAPNSKITSIGDGAFKYTSITTVSIPENVEGKEIVLGTGVFEGCDALTSATVSVHVKDLNNAFVGCSALMTLNYTGAGLTDDTVNKLLLKEIGEAGSGRYSIVFYYGTGATLDIPANVVEIGSSAFSGKANLKTVNIHQNVTTIHDGAFKGAGLTAVNFIETAENPSKLNMIGASAFEGTQLVELKLPASLVVKEANAGKAVGDNAFKGITTLTKVTVNGTAVGVSMFEGCTALVDVTLNSNITTLPKKAFMGAAFTSITLPTALTTVGESVFENCKQLTSVTLPENLQVGKSYDVAGYKLFASCTALTTVNLNANLKYIAGGMFQNCTSLQNITLPQGLEVISTYGFANCTSLTTLNFPSSLTSYEGYSFQKAGLTEFDISNTKVSALTAYGLNGMTNLTTVKLPTSVTSIGNHLPACNNIVTLIAPGVTSIGGNALKSRTNLTTVQFSDQLATIGNSAFESCTQLANFEFPDSVTSIGNKAFKGTALAVAELGNNLTTIGSEAFAGTKIATITISASVESIGAGAFSGCTNLSAIKVDTNNTNFRSGAYGELYDANNNTLLAFPTKSTGEAGYVEIEEGVAINANAFEGTTGIQFVKLPSTLVNVPDYLFLNSSVVSVEFASGTRTLGVSVFEGCKKLQTIEFPDTVVEFGNYTFKNCTALSKVVLPTYLTTISNRTFENCANLSEVVMPSLLKTIEAGAFMGSGVTTLDCGDYLETIDTLAFQNAKIESIQLGNSLKYLGAKAFDGSKIKSIVIPASIVEIGSEDMKNGLIAQVFMNCTELKTVIFNGAPQTMYKEMFKGCTALESVTLNGNWEEIPEATFQGCTALKSIVIPETVETLGKNAFQASGLTSVVIPASVKTIGLKAPSGGGIPMGRAGIPMGPTTTYSSLVFANCTSLKTVVFNGAPANMYGGTFKGCTALESVTLNGNWTKLEEGMFDGCTSLTGFTVPATVTSIGKDAFKGWTATQVINVPDKTQAEATTAWGANWSGSATVNYKQEVPQA